MIIEDFLKEYDLMIRRLTIVALSLDQGDNINKQFIRTKLEKLYGRNTNFDVDIKTIDRDIKYIQDNFGLEYEHVGTNDYRFLELTNEDKLALAIEIFLSLIMESRELKNSFKALARSDNKLILLNLMYINAAIKTSRVIKIKYILKYYPEKEYEIELHPYDITYNYGKWYLIGYSTYKKDFRQYIIENITGVDYKDRYFNRAADFSLPDYYSSSLKSFRKQNERKKFKVWFSKNVLDEIRLIYNLQNLNIEEQKDGSIIADFSADGNKELIDWIWQFETEAKILEPKSARNEIKKRAKKIRKLY